MAFLTVNLKPELKRALAEKGYHFPDPPAAIPAKAPPKRAKARRGKRQP